MSPRIVSELLDQALAALDPPQPQLDALRDLVEFGALGAAVPPFFTEFAYRR